MLAQIIFEQENKEGQSLLPIAFLRQLIRFYGDSMQMLVPRYLEVSIDIAHARAGEVPRADGAGLRRSAAVRPARGPGAAEHGNVRARLRHVRAVRPARRRGSETEKPAKADDSPSRRGDSGEIDDLKRQLEEMQKRLDGWATSKD